MEFSSQESAALSEGGEELGLLAGNYIEKRPSEGEKDASVQYIE